MMAKKAKPAIATPAIQTTTTSRFQSVDEFVNAWLEKIIDGSKAVAGKIMVWVGNKRLEYTDNYMVVRQKVKVLLAEIFRAGTEAQYGLN